MVIPLGISVQLFSENITVFVVFYAVWIVVYTLIRYKKIPLIELNFLWASIAGALIMFSNGAYSRAADGSDGYKEIHTTVSGMARQFISNIWYHLSINNWVLNILLIIVLLILIQKSGRKTFATIEMTIVFCGYSVYSVFHKIYPQWVFDSDQNLNNAINTMLAILFFANVLLCIWKNVEQERGNFHVRSSSVIGSCGGAASGGESYWCEMFLRILYFSGAGAVEASQISDRQIQDRVVLSYTDNRNGGLCSVCDICKNVFGNRSGKRLQSTIDTDGNRAGTEGNCAACSAVFGIFLSDYTAK